MLCCVNIIYLYYIFICNNQDLYHCLVIQEVEIPTAEKRETAIRRNGACHVLVKHFVVHYGQFQSRRISSDRQTEEDHLHHR